VNTKHVRLEDLAATIRADLAKIPRRVLGASRTAARRGVPIAKGTAPVAFQELADSIDAHDTPFGAIIRADAPHAAAVENGSRPHMPPVEPIERWVKLRGTQGLAGSRHRAARAMARAIQRAGSGAAGRDAAGRFTRRKTSTPIDAPRQIAWAIAMKIKKSGTKPQPFMRIALPFVVLVLDDEVVRTLEQPL
jgi:hypothetical protein